MAPTDSSDSAAATTTVSETNPSAEKWDAVAMDFMLAEYKSLRDESSQSRSAQQAIQQWSLAGVSAILVGGLLLTGKNFDLQQAGPPSTAFLVLFGVVLPALATVSCMAWLGELVRMERCGRYLRGFERDLSKRLNGLVSPAARNPLRWETAISQGAASDKGLGRGKQRVGYLGSLLMYLGAVSASLCFYVVGVQQRQEPANAWVHLHLALFAWPAVMGSVFLAIVVSVVRSIQELGAEVLELPEVELQKPDGDKDKREDQ